VPTSDEAYALMRKHRPDLILCDINLETSTMGGFSFYEKVQEVPHLQDVPFVFLTGLTDEVLVRAGKELGVDDYLMKPISQQLLISTLKGKLKRYRQLRTAAPTNAAA
jgi:CheY-like chemotaxis protein